VNSRGARPGRSGRGAPGAGADARHRPPRRRRHRARNRAGFMPVRGL